jgi:hypothetical protein
MSLSWADQEKENFPNNHNQKAKVGNISAWIKETILKLLGEQSKRQKNATIIKKMVINVHVPTTKQAYAQ